MGADVKEMDRIDRIFAEGTAIDLALRKAVREAVQRHKKLGNPIATWRDGQVVWIAPEDIRVDEPSPDDGKKPVTSSPTDFAF
jgi:hypothetical protein